jgi:hypothetical protein
MAIYVYAPTQRRRLRRLINFSGCCLLPGLPDEINPDSRFCLRLFLTEYSYAECPTRTVLFSYKGLLYSRAGCDRQEDGHLFGSGIETRLRGARFRRRRS